MEAPSKSSRIQDALKKFTVNAPDWADLAVADEPVKPAVSEQERKIRDAVEAVKGLYLVYVSDLSPQTTCEDVFFYFGGETNVLEVFFYDDDVTKGDVLLELSSKEALVQALLLNGTEIFRKKIMVEYVDPIRFRCCDILNGEPVGFPADRNAGRQQQMQVRRDVGGGRLKDGSFKLLQRADVTRLSNDVRNLLPQVVSEPQVQKRREEAAPPVVPKPAPPPPKPANNPFGKAKPVDTRYLEVERQEKEQRAQRSRPDTQKSSNQSQPPSLMQMNLNPPAHSAGPQVTAPSTSENKVVDVDTESTHSTVKTRDSVKKKPKGGQRHGNKQRDNNNRKQKSDHAEVMSVASSRPALSRTTTKSVESLTLSEVNAPAKRQQPRLPDASMVRKYLNDPKEKNAPTNKNKDNSLPDEQPAEEAKAEKSDPVPTSAPTKSKKRNKKNKETSGNLGANKFNVLIDHTDTHY